jgi:quercetin dioxygenase-like cupin family protein
MLDDTTRTYYVESGNGEFIIDGIKNEAKSGNFFIIEP